MKTAQQWFDEYAISHQNQTNQLIHYICVPAIFFSVIGLLMSIPSSFLSKNLKLYNPLIENWAFFISLLILLFFYLRLGFWYFIQMFLVTSLSIIGNYFLGKQGNLLLISIGVFVIAWIGQFYGHKVEGKKPSFIKDLQFLLIGPLWVLQKLGK
ncbi:hypothetical protein WH52_06270 [Tenacibaculum holothuriorum]|uniref:DUF962 domain-containing protein n=1 Tax=Tenacibaculum holothuriorum TaxID=1635173 RepID=A0A1Y2PD12_9FLAO|nr:Mpo1-like protein [Tenacibaculum holothuriorum]OSY88363.1 hypothetical protein WH52_06270 [Tenacibaculum holothuriorum]